MTALIRIAYARRPDLFINQSPTWPDVGTSIDTHTKNGYLVVTKRTRAPGAHRKARHGKPQPPLPGVPIIVQYARRISDVEATVSRVRLFLILGVLGGAGLALGAGLLVARRAMKPIDELTGIAREISQTRDPSQRMPVSSTDDEVGRARPDARRDARGAGPVARRDRGDAQPPAAVRRRRLTRAAHAADQRDGQPRSAGRRARRRPGRRGPLGAAVVQAHAPARRRPAAARPRRRPAPDPPAGRRHAARSSSRRPASSARSPTTTS